MKLSIAIIAAILGIIICGAGCRGTTMKASEFFSDHQTTDLAEAAARGNATRVTSAVAGGARVNEVGRDGITPLLYVLSTTKNIDGIKVLLQHGADPNYMEPRGISPILVAAEGNDPQVLRLMLDHGGDPNRENQNGEPALFLAAQQFRWENVSLLLNAGANIDGHDRSGYTVVMLMAMLGQYQQVEKLLQRGADANLPARSGQTLSQIVEMIRISPSSPEYAARDRVRRMITAQSKE